MKKTIIGWVHKNEKKQLKAGYQKIGKKHLANMIGNMNY